MLLTKTPASEKMRRLIKSPRRVAADWKKPERKRKNLIRLGVKPDMAYQWSRTRMGGWAVAQSPILGTTITISRLVKRGYEPMLSYYKQVNPSSQINSLFPIA